MADIERSQMNVGPLRFRLPRRRGQGPLIIPAEAVESIVLKAVEQESGHIIVAHHYRAHVYGIAIEFERETEPRTAIEALYKLRDRSIQNFCVITAAGPAAELLYKGGLDEQGASGDLHEIERVTGIASFEPYMSQAKDILTGYRTQFEYLTRALRTAIETPKERVLKVLPGRRIGAYLLNKKQLLECLEG